MAKDPIDAISDILDELDALLMPPGKRDSMPVEVRQLLAEARFRLDQRYLKLYEEEEPREVARGAHA